MESLWGDGEDSPEPVPSSSGVPRQVHSSEAPAPHRVAAAQASPRCAACQKPFRGAWDRVNTGAGIVCHICANRIEHSPSKASRPLIEKAAAPRPVRVDAPEDSLEDMRRNRKGLMLLLGSGAVIMAGVMLLPVEVWIAQVLALGREVRTGEVALSPIWRYTIVALRLVSDYLYFVLLLVLIQWLSNQVSKRDFLHDLLNNAFQGLVLFAVFMPYYFAPIGLVVLTITLIQVFILIGMDQHKLSQCFAFGLLALLLGGFVSPVIAEALTGLIAGIVL